MIKEFFKKKSQTLIFHVKFCLLERKRKSRKSLMRENSIELRPGKASEKSPGPSFLFRQKFRGNHPRETVPACSRRKPRVERCPFHAVTYGSSRHALQALVT